MSHEESNIDVAADALLAEITKAGGVMWVASLKAYYLAGAPVEHRLVKYLWDRGSLHYDTVHTLIARNLE
jgi:hypothetical protein